MAGSEQKTEAPEKPKYDRKWLENFVEFGEQCPKLNPLGYVPGRASREEACDLAHKEMSTLAEYMLKIKSSLIDGVPNEDGIYAKNDVFLLMMKSCGNHMCGDCTKPYIETKVLLERKSMAKGEEYFLSHEERAQKWEREHKAEVEKDAKELAEERKAREKKEVL